MKQKFLINKMKQDKILIENKLNWRDIVIWIFLIAAFVLLIYSIFS